MNRICDDLSPELDIQEDEDQSPLAPIEEVQLKYTDIPSSFDFVSLVPFSPSQPTKKRGQHRHHHSI
jgi:hypothetical protein